MPAESQPFLAAYSMPASTALLTCIASYMANPRSTVPTSRMNRNGINSANSMAAVPDSLRRPDSFPNLVLVGVINAPRLLDKPRRAATDRNGALRAESGVIVNRDLASDQLTAGAGIQRRVVVELEDLIRKIDGRSE